MWLYTAVVSAVWRLKEEIASLRPDPISKANKPKPGIDGMDAREKEVVPETRVP